MKRKYNDKIKYLAHYNMAQSMQNRYMAPSACAKIDYIVHSLERLGIETEIISASNSLDKNYKPMKKELGNRHSVTFLRGFRRGTRFVNKVSTFLFYINLLWYLLRHVTKEDTLLVYHSLLLMRLVVIVKKMKKCRVIIEAEELYGDVMEKSAVVEREMNFFRHADAYLFPTEMLNARINIENKPYTVVHGVYQVEALRESERDEFFSDDKIHCVYAGTFDPRKAGALTAIAVAEYLPKNYHLHILGFGSKDEIEQVQNKIEEVSLKSSCQITYDGCRCGDEYIRFIQNCDIGLSTQNPSAAFNDTSFPSKILSYMANGLQVVSVRIPAIESSAIGSDIYYYERQTPSEIAEAIRNVILTDSNDVKRRIEELDGKFCIELGHLVREEDVMEVRGDR